MGKQQAILKAVEVNTSVGMDLDFPGNPDLIIYPTQSLFPNILALASDINDQLVTATAGYTGGSTHIVLELYSGYYRFLTYTPGTGNNPVLKAAYDPLGFTAYNATLSNVTINGLTGSWLLATNPPEDSFFPTYYSSDSNLFAPESEESFTGVTGVDGNLSGASFTERWQRDITWSFEHAYNAVQYAPNATTVQANRSFTAIINGARKNSLTISTDNSYCKGVYFIDDLSVYFAESGTIDKFPTSWGSGTVNGDYVFCSTSAPSINDASFDNSKLYYNIGCRLKTAVSPTWTWDIS